MFDNAGMWGHAKKRRRGGRKEVVVVTNNDRPAGPIEIRGVETTPKS